MFLRKDADHKKGGPIMQKFLMAVDGSNRCNQAIASLAKLLKDVPECNVLLYHCMPSLAGAHYRAMGELPHQYEIPAERQNNVGGGILEQSRNVLLENGFPKRNVEVQLKLNSDDPAMDIVAQAKGQGIGTIVLGRRGLSRVETILVGSVSRRVAEHSGSIAVWVVDAPLNQSQKVLLAVQGVPGGQLLNHYAVENTVHLPYAEYAFIHLMPPMPPYLWDDGHILGANEKSTRQAQIDDWQSGYKRQFEMVMAQGKDALARRGIKPENVQIRVEPTRVGIARDLLDEIAREQYQMVIVGKKSLQKKTPFLLGSFANKLLHNAKGVILCLVGSE
jgi:nucleotide-binding universal stress UspA family protein